MTTQANTHYIESMDNQITGWYVGANDSDFEASAIEGWSWQDRGNGPELNQQDVYGPFGSQKEAIEWFGAREAYPVGD